jgi:hypothetical protein
MQLQLGRPQLANRPKEKVLKVAAAMKTVPLRLKMRSGAGRL